MKQLEIKENDANQRLDKFIQKTFVQMPNSLMYKAIRNKKIKINKKRCTHNQMLKTGDIIEFYLPEDALVTKTFRLPKVSADIDVVYEDDNVLVVYKPAGLLSQSDTIGDQDCLIYRVWAYLAKKGELDMESHSFHPALTQRLDRNTRGLVLVAKQAQALRTINAAIAQHTIQKVYRAKVQGILETLDFDCLQYMKKEETKSLVSPVEKEGYKEARMHIKVIREEKGDCWVDILLETGRFHQIRSGLAALGHPLVGDQKYGYTGKEKQYWLEAYRLDCSQLDLEMEEKIFERLSQ